MHFGAQRKPKNSSLWSHVEAISSLVAKVRMKLLCKRQHCFRGFRASEKRWISPLFSEGVRGSSGMACFDAFDDFGFPPGFKKEAILELASVFSRSEISTIFEVSDGRAGGRGGAHLKSF